MRGPNYLAVVKWCLFFMLLVIAMFIIFAGCYVGRGYVPIKLHKGESVVRVDLGETLIVSEGYVHAAYSRWRGYMSRLAAQERLCMLSVTTNADGTWTIKKSVFWED